MQSVKLPTSEVIIHETEGNGVLLLVKKVSDQKYYLFLINSINGGITFDGIEGSSIFASKHQAFKAIQSNYILSAKSPVIGQALIGAARYGPVLYILIIKQSSPVARIQNVHTIFSITETEFFKINLHFHRPLTQQEQRRIDRIVEFPVAEYHLWCETKDLTVPIYSDQHDSSFLWNKHWTKVFDDLGQKDVCIDLLQGTATSQMIYLNPCPKSEVKSTDNTPTKPMYYRFTIIAIRESTNGGTRYYARGLDDEHHPANEVQCHIIVESNDGRLWSHVWRRGSIPVRWSTVIAKNLPTVSISIQPDCGKDTHFYFDYLKTFYPENIFCINLLHNSQTNSEYPLCVAYQNSVERFEHVQYIEFDWHKEVKEKGVSGAVKLLYIYLPEINFTRSETDQPINVDINTHDQNICALSASMNLFPNEIGDKNLLPLLGKTFSKIQDSTVRINCMDSLDRTNVVSFFYAAKVVSTILFEAGIISAPASTYENIMALPSQIRRFLCEAFLGIGDCVSYLYTNTPACMTEIFHEVAEDDIKTKSDSSIAVKRRYHNFLTDRKRQKAYNMFLGKCFEKHIPNIDCSPLPICVSMGSAQFMPPFLNDGKNPIDPTNLLQISSYTIQSIGSTTVIMLLDDVCFVSDIYMIISPPNPPTSVSISSSLSFGMKQYLVEKVALPYVTRPQPVYIKIPPDRNNYELNMMRFLTFEFDGKTIDGNCKPYKPNSMTLSNIFVFGHRTCNPDSVKKYYNFTYQEFPSTTDKKRNPNLTLSNSSSELADSTSSFHENKLIPVVSSSNERLLLEESKRSEKLNVSPTGSNQSRLVSASSKARIPLNDKSINSGSSGKLPPSPRSQLPSSTSSALNSLGGQGKPASISQSHPNLLKDNSAGLHSNNQDNNDNSNQDHAEEQKTFQFPQKTEFDDVLKDAKFSSNVDFLLTIHYEDARIVKHIGRLQSLKLAALRGFNPLDMNFARFFRNIPELGTTQSPCCVCGNTSSWECFFCRRKFCANKKCSKQVFYHDAFFFKQSSVVCEKCSETLDKYKFEVENLKLGYKSFFFLENQIEGELNKFITDFINDKKQKKIDEMAAALSKSVKSGYITELSYEQRKQQIIHKPIESDPSKFPLAFFIDAFNPKFNLLLTDEGTSITPKDWGKSFFCVALGCRLELTSVLVKGSNDCVIRMTQGEGKTKLDDIKANVEFNCQGFCGRLFSLNLVSGTINSIYFKGKRIARVEIPQKSPTINFVPIKLKFMKNRSLPVNNKIVTTDIGRDKPITAVLLQNMYGVRSLLIMIFKQYIMKPSKVIKRYVPQVDGYPDFLVALKKPVMGSKVEVHILDCDQIKDPKVMII